MIEDSIVLQVWLFVMLLVFLLIKGKVFAAVFKKKFNKYCYFAYKMKGFCCCF